MAPTYRQNDSIPKELCTDNHGIATRWLRAVLKLLLHCGCNLKQKKEGSPGPLTIKAKSADDRALELYLATLPLLFQALKAYK
jgi:hypothetical protein